MTWISENWTAIMATATAVFTGVLLIAKAIAALTPSLTDDQWIAKVEEVFKNVVKK